MNYKSKPRWTKSQELFLLRMCGTMTDQEIATRLQKSLKSIRRKREEMELTKKQGRGICELVEGPISKRALQAAEDAAKLGKDRPKSE